MSPGVTRLGDRARYQGERRRWLVVLEPWGRSHSFLGWSWDRCRCGIDSPASGDRLPSPHPPWDQGMGRWNLPETACARRPGNPAEPQACLLLPQPWVRSSDAQISRGRPFFVFLSLPSCFSRPRFSLYDCPHWCQLTDVGRHEACIFFLGKAVQEGKFSLSEGVSAGALDAPSVLPQLKVGRARWWGHGVGDGPLVLPTPQGPSFCSPLLYRLLVQPGLNRDRSPGSSRGWSGDQRKWQDVQVPGPFRGLSPPDPRQTIIELGAVIEHRHVWSILSS